MNDEERARFQRLLDTEAKNRVAVRVLLLELLDEYIPIGEMKRIIRSVRQSISEDDDDAMYPEGRYGELINELLDQLIPDRS